MEIVVSVATQQDASASCRAAASSERKEAKAAAVSNIFRTTASAYSLFPRLFFSLHNAAHAEKYEALRRIVCRGGGEALALRRSKVSMRKSDHLAAFVAKKFVSFL